MNYCIEKINDNVAVCLVYIDNIDNELGKLIEDNFFEIIMGKKNAEKIKTKDAFLNALKYITLKINAKTETNIVGIVGEFLFHCFMRVEENANRFLSIFPTIGYSNGHQFFYKGFDGCYYSEDKLWIVEVKSAVNSSNIDNDNKQKLKEASKQIETEANDSRLNRWEEAKKLVVCQIEQQDIDAKKIYDKLTINSSSDYNKLLGSMIILDKGEFNLDFIKTYINDFFDTKVINQKIFAMCIRNCDYKKIVNYLESRFGDNYE